MIIKVTLICLAFVPLVIGSVSGNPTDESARVGKFLGWLADENNKAAPLKLFVSTNRRWNGELSLTFGRRPLIASAELFYYIGQPKLHEPVPVLHNILLESESMSGAHNNSDPLSVSSDMHRDDVTEEMPLDDATGETTQVTSRALKLEDYDEITLNPDTDENRVKREATQIEHVNVGLSTGDDAEDETDSTTVESSTVAMKLQEHDSSDSNFVTLAPEASDASSHQNFYYIPSSTHFPYPYPPSRNPSAQHVTITYSPHHHQPPMKNFYDFYPSQPDYNQHSFAPCINFIQQKFTPTENDAWTNYRKWK